ncbi:MAG TPA: hypothetical protein VH951_00830 [Dehalococcoidia bacterium]
MLGEQGATNATRADVLDQVLDAKAAVRAALKRVDMQVQDLPQR